MGTPVETQESTEVHRTEAERVERDFDHRAGSRGGVLSVVIP
jgi:hypothetical protein